MLKPSNQYRLHKCRYWCQCKSGVSDKLCYLGDMLSVDRDADAAVEDRIQIVLTIKDISLTMRGRLYSSCVQSTICIEVRPGL